MYLWGTWVKWHSLHAHIHVNNSFVPGDPSRWKPSGAFGVVFSLWSLLGLWVGFIWFFSCSTKLYNPRRHLSALALGHVYSSYFLSVSWFSRCLSSQQMNLSPTPISYSSSTPGEFNIHLDLKPKANSKCGRSFYPKCVSWLLRFITLTKWVYSLHFFLFQSRSLLSWIYNFHTYFTKFLPSHVYQDQL